MLSKRALLSAALVFFTPTLPRAAFNFFNVDDTSQIPLLLSQTGAYDNILNNVITSRAVYFEVNTPFWADGAHKERWILLPPGKSLVYSDTVDFFTFPESTVVIKTFSNRRVENNPSTEFRWETRLLISKNDPITGTLKWHGYSYKWRFNETEADLVSRDEYTGLDTVFAYTGGDGVLTYKKWHYPNKNDCYSCHRINFSVPRPLDTVYARTLLAFFPAQLKRVLPSGYNQIDWLFDQGVFTGQRPNWYLNTLRWKDVREALPPVTNPEHRFKTLDTMSRSYLAANCSGCHGHRGLENGALQGSEKNWDYYRLNPYVWLDSVYTGAYGLNDTLVDTTLFGQKSGHQYFMLSAQHAGLDMSAGKPWELAMPAGVDPATINITAIYPGYPALSELLYRIMARNTPWNDSETVLRDYVGKVNRVCNPASPSYAKCVSDSTFARNRLGWLFRSRWGSQAWLDTLNGRGYPLDSAVFWASGQYPHSQQMPPLVTYLPDTAALKVLGEWVQSYDEAQTNGWVPSGIKVAKNPRKMRFASPYIRNNMLILPAGIQGKVQLMNINGKILKLQSAGDRRYSVPGRLSSGIYYVKVGAQIFRVPMM